VCKELSFGSTPGDAFLDVGWHDNKRIYAYNIDVYISMTIYYIHLLYDVLPYIALNKHDSLGQPYFVPYIYMYIYICIYIEIYIPYINTRYNGIPLKSGAGALAQDWLILDPTSLRCHWNGWNAGRGEWDD
jgi:hypothetical protein